jgi:DNA-directed RNA polymerase specialized sigma24 family protein
MQLFTDTRSDGVQAEAFYTRHFPALVHIATTRFAMAEDDAEDLADAILVSSLRHLPAIEDPQAWLLGALTSAAARKEVES